MFWRPLAHGVITLEDLYGPPPYKTGYPMTWVLKASYALEIKAEKEKEQREKQERKAKREAQNNEPRT